jgi:hypothetical protein
MCDIQNPTRLFNKLKLTVVSHNQIFAQEILFLAEIFIL